MIASTVIQELGGDAADPEAVIATTLAAFALSSILTGSVAVASSCTSLTRPGIAFFILGYFKLGNLISFFPRHILIGALDRTNLASG